MQDLSFLFDLGNVLTICDIHKGAREIAARSNVTDQEIVERIMTAEIIDEFDRGTLDGESFAEHVQKLTGWQGTSAELEQIWNQMLHADEQMISLLEELSARGHKVFILSNINAYHVRYVMDAFPALKRASGAVFSCECGMIKPEEEIFRHTAASLNVDPEWTVFIDDRLVNIEAAKRVGYQVIHHTSAEQTRDAIYAMIS